MTIINGYTTLAEYKSYITSAGQTLTVDPADDSVIERFIVSASRRVDALMGRTFYPRVEAFLYDLPGGRSLWLGDDLLSVITLTNGDSTAIASTEYKLYPANMYPKHTLSLTDVTTTYFLESSTGSSEQVITLTAFWGYHDRYAQRSWKAVGTLGAAISTTTAVTHTLTAGHTLAPGGGQIIKIDNELMITVSSAALSVLVDARGENGSTAATHLNGATVYAWQHMEEINQLALEITKMMYNSRHGVNVETTSTITAGGVVVTPRSLPVWAREIIDKYRRRV